jgi:hypothetical protein
MVIFLMVDDRQDEKTQVSLIATNVNWDAASLLSQVFARERIVIPE